eukprot:g38167.t1
MAGADKQLSHLPLNTTAVFLPVFCLTAAIFARILARRQTAAPTVDHLPLNTTPAFFACAAKELRQLWTTYHTGVDFLAVYITEAHAKDEWPVGPTFSFAEQPKTQAARLALARLHQQRSQLPFPVVVDDIATNAFETLYAAWPYRFYILYQGRIMYKAQPDEAHMYTFDAAFHRALAPHLETAAPGAPRDGPVLWLRCDI